MGLVYNVFLPGFTDTDLVKRVIKLTINGVESTFTVAPDVKVYTLPPVKESSTVEISLQDVDDAGNSSDWSESLTFVAADTIIPSTPGKVSVKLTAEVADPVPVVVQAEAVVAPVVVETPETPPVSE